MPVNRTALLDQIRRRTDRWDLVVIGGGATGVGIAVDAASRGYSVALLEQDDFGKGTSGRSTKLIHGGVRYLQQGNIPLVMEALKERGILRRNAPHLVHDLRFIVPNYQWWEAPFYGVGMKVYDALAGRYGFGRSRNLSVSETLDRIPTLETAGLRGGVSYHDGQFDDARLLIHLVLTALEQGAVAVNHIRVTGLVRDHGFVDGVQATDGETGEELELKARLVVNATGVFADGVRRLDDPSAAPLIRPSQGVHIVLDRSFMPGDSAIMVPQTDDGRVLFAIPWNERVLVGTTDTPVTDISLEPRALEEEITFLVEHAARYLTKDPEREDVLSVFAGLRPLVDERGSGAGDTSTVSREHSIVVSKSGMLTIAGGKWTTYRKMAQDVVDHAITLAGLEPKPCVTKRLPIHGHHRNAKRFGPLAQYGADAPGVEALIASDPTFGEPLHPRLPVRRGEVVWGAREEMARTVDDVLSRRTRSLLLDARASLEAAPAVAEVLARELDRDTGWTEAQVDAFQTLASGYLP